jgi:hypothetical protein
MSAFALMMRSVGLLTVAYSFENRCKSCVVSAIDDRLDTIKSFVLNAAYKQRMNRPALKIED